MSNAVDEETRPPYAPFLALSRFWKGSLIAGAVMTVIAFGFVSVSIRFGGGGSGWPLHDALHPLLGLFFGPVYGPICSVLGATVSEIVTPYTALDGLSPILGGVSALTTGLLMKKRGWWRVWGLILALDVGYLVIARLHGVPYSIWIQNTLPVTISLVLAASPAVRAWWQRHLAPSSWSWQTAAALYVLSFVGASFGILSLWTVGMLVDPFPAEAWPSVTSIIYTERLLFPFIGTLLGIALWPALRRGPLSIANQLRYGLPFCLLLTICFAGRLFMEQAYDDAKTESIRQLHRESQAAARAIGAKLTRAETLLRRRTASSVPLESLPLFRAIERVPMASSPADSAFAPVGTLLDRARATGEPQRGFVALPDTAAHTVALAVLVATGEEASSSEIIVGVLAPDALHRTLSIWDESPSCFYLISETNVPIAERRSPVIESAPSPLVTALRRSSGSTASAAQGRYGEDVLGARASLPNLSGAVVVERTREEAYFHAFTMLLSMGLVALVGGGGALVMGFYLTRRVVDPLDRLIEAARRVSDGDLSTRVSVKQDNELGELADTFNTMIQDLAASVQRLQANEERLRIALDAAQMGTWNWQADTGALTCSPQTYAIFGVPEDRTDTLPAAYLARVHPDDREDVVREIDAILQSGSDFEFEHRIRPERAEERWVKVKGRVFREEDQPKRMSGVVMDVTARKETERELVAAKEEAEEMSRLKSAFLANVSHEIRTPLTSIIGFSEVLVDEVPAEQEGIATKIVESGRRLKTTLDSVLDLSMIEAGEFSLECQDVNLAEEVRRRTDLLRSRAEREGLDFVVEAPLPGPEVRLDPSCLDRILTNLVSNAVKFTEEGRVAVRVRENDSHVALQVSDTGIGIDEDFLPDLFEAFKQESEGLQREHEGTGLGLSITKELVELMNGDIEVESQKGEGTTFTVRLPYRVPAEG